MRIFYKLLFVLLIIITLFSVTTTAVFALSSTLLPTENNRKQIFYTAQNKLSNLKEITIVATKPYSNVTGQISKDVMSCVVVSNEYNCQMISSLYNRDSSLVRTSYFPNDGFKYSIEGNDRTKASYPNESLNTYFSSLIAMASQGLSYISFNNAYVRYYNIEFDEDIDFDFSSFSFSKSIDVSCVVSNQEQEIDLEFNKDNYLTKVDFDSMDIELKIKYKTTKLNFPDFSGFVQE